MGFDQPEGQLRPVEVRRFRHFDSAHLHIFEIAGRSWVFIRSMITQGVLGGPHWLLKKIWFSWRAVANFLEIFQIKIFQNKNLIRKFGAKLLEPYLQLIDCNFDFSRAVSLSFTSGRQLTRPVAQFSWKWPFTVPTAAPPATDLIHVFFIFSSSRPKLTLLKTFFLAFQI